MRNSMKVSRFKFICSMVTIMIVATIFGVNNHVTKSLAAGKKEVTVKISKDDQFIPSKSSQDGVDLVKDGKILYKVKVKAVFTYKGDPVIGLAVKFSDPDTKTVKLVSKNNQTNNKGAAYAWYEVRGQVDFKVKASVDSDNYSYKGSKSATISPSKKAKYSHKFRVTFYYIPKEGDSEFTGSRISVPGISNYKFKKDFIEKVKNAGSGYSTHGFYIQYNESKKVFAKLSGKPKTASGTTPTENRTIAANNFTIPRKCVDGTWQRGCVKISNHDAYYRNEDTGGDFDENKSSELYNIDIFAGEGAKKLKELTDKYDTAQETVKYLGNNQDLW